MERVAHNPLRATGPVGQFRPEVKKDKYSLGEIAAASFAQENVVMNAIEYMARPSFEADSSFDILSALDEEPLAIAYSHQLSRAQSKEEFASIKARILKEQRDKEIIASAPVTGFIMASVAGLLSPTTLVPFAGGARGLLGAAQSFSLAAAAVSIDEAALYGLQETRTLEEVAMGVAIGTVLGGLLGTAARSISPAERALIERRMVEEQGPTTIQRSTEEGGIEHIELDDPITVPIVPSPSAVSPSKVDTPDPAPSSMAAAVSSPRDQKLTLTRKRSAEGEELAWGGSYLRADLPNGYEVRFVKSTPGSGGMHHSDGSYVMTILRADGTEVSPNLGKEDFYNSALHGGTTKYKVAELREAVEAGEFNKTIDAILTKAGESPVFDLPIAAEATQSIGAARVRGDVRGIARANTYVGRQVDRSADWLAAKGVPVIPKVIKTLNDPIGMLAKLNPLTRQLDNKTFPSSRANAARMQIPGIKLEGQSATKGTIFARAQSHDAAVAKALQKLDDAWAEYVTDGKGGKIAQAAVASQYKVTGRAPQGKMNFAQFEETVFVYGQTGKIHDSPAVMKAVDAQREYYDYYNKVADDYYQARLAEEGTRKRDPRLDEVDPDSDEFEELLEQIIAEGNEELVGPRRLFKKMEFGEDAEIQNYVHHQFDDVVVDKQTPEFLEDFTNHFEKEMEAQYKTDLEKFTKRQESLDAMEEILSADESTLNTMFASVSAMRNEIDVTYAAPLKQSKALRASMKAAGADSREISEAVSQLESAFGPDYPLAMKQRRQLDKKLSVLKKVGAGLTEKQSKLLDEIDELDELQINALDSLASAGQKLYNKLDAIAAKEGKVDAEIKKLYASVVKSANEYLKRYNKAEKLAAKDKLTAAENSQAKADKAFVRFDKAVEKISKQQEKLPQLDAMRKSLDDILEGKIARTKRLNAQRAVREDRLAKKAKEMSPELRAQYRQEELKEVKKTSAEHKLQFNKKWEERGALGEASQGFVSLRDRARLDAEELHMKILGNPLRVVGIEVLTGKRGPQLQRMLVSMPLETKMKYLNRRPEILLRSHAHTMAPDVEMYRMTGSVNGARIFEELKYDYEVAKSRLDDMPAGPEREKASLKLNKEYQDAVTDWQVLVDRFRHQRAIPTNPNGILYRAGRFAMNLNVTRFMGMVMVSSLPDMARVTFRYGMMGTFRDAWAPLVNDIARVKATREEAYRMGIALDPLLHNRAHMLHDTYDNYSTRQTLAERGMEFLANKTGFVALFDRWTAENKLIATNAVLGEFSHALRVLSDRAGHSAKEVKKAEELFTYTGLDMDMMRRIFDQYERPGGSTEFKNGFRLPNTEAWDDFEAVMGIRSAVNQIVNDLIITPGLDRPSWMDQNLAFKMVGQFRSFTFSATNRIVMSGLQEPDMAFLQGSIFSIALGAISYYTWAASVGGTALKEAGEADMEKVLYEAVGRSGILGVLSEGQRIGEQIPGLNDLAIFGSDESQTRRASSVLGAVLGPSYDLAERIATVVQGMSDPTQSTLRTARTMVPYQNVVYLRQLLTLAEENLADAIGLPERRN